MARSKHLVDPELKPLLTFFPPLVLEEGGLDQLRAATPPPALATPTEVEPVSVERRLIVGPAGAPPVSVLIYTPRSARTPLPAVVHLHAGGFVLGSAAASQSAHRRLAAEVGCVLVSVDYRLAPETRFPGALEDSYAALAFVQQQAADLGVDPARVAVLGESAGGGLAAGLALLARDRGEYPIVFQQLLYPMLDDRTGSTEDPHPFAGEFLWTGANNAFGWAAYLGVAPGSVGVSPYAAAARAEGLSGLPPAFIATGALDLFIDEDLEYARRLIRHGVPVELHVYPGAVHCFDLVADARIARDARRDGVAALRRALGAG